jgi:4a-hydroxytetrahydrobiopterin dehydratase
MAKMAMPPQNASLPIRQTTSGAREAVSLQGRSEGAAMAALGSEALQHELAKLPGWSLAGKTIHKRYTFKSFLAGIEFVDRIALAAESAGHHPDIAINYTAVGISLSTHSAGGITEKDLALAGAIDHIYAARA